ncbi:MAG: cytochrome P460 family protein [Rhodospirillales bacterium]|nr:cytochrome P460 family protein [Rhodospirillales bacterium]
MNRLPIALALTGAVALVALGGHALVAADKYSVAVPDGLALSEFKGYEDWAVVGASQTEDNLKAMVANPTMMAAYKAGVPLNGRAFPDGSTIAKIQWKPMKSTEAPFDVRISTTLNEVLFITKDSKRFPNSAGWGYARFTYDVATDTYKPDGRGTDCGHACHTIVKSKDYIFTAYGKR